MEKRMRVLLLSVVTILIGVMVLVGGTFALFSDTVTVNNHLEAGSLKVGLKRTNYQQHVLDENGKMHEMSDNTIVDLLDTKDKVFNITNAVPTSWYSATIEVSNLGDIAFDYGVRILWNEVGSATEKQIKFAEQIMITVSETNGAQIKEFKLVNYDGNDIEIGTISKKSDSTATQSFIVKAEFLNTPDNNETQLITLDFDLQVYALQNTTNR